MKLLFETIFYFFVVLIFVILNCFTTVESTNPKTNFADLMFESAQPRMRRNVDPRVAGNGDVLKDAFNMESRIRNRRQVPAGESDMAKGLPEEMEKIQNKRQVPSPPGEMPMPPL